MNYISFYLPTKSGVHTCVPVVCTAASGERRHDTIPVCPGRRVSMRERRLTRSTRTRRWLGARRCRLPPAAGSRQSQRPAHWAVAGSVAPAHVSPRRDGGSPRRCGRARAPCRGRRARARRHAPRTQTTTSFSWVRSADGTPVHRRHVSDRAGAAARARCLWLAGLRVGLVRTLAGCQLLICTSDVCVTY
jgi:hypothetical protein